jgi:uncharacterized membrane protein SpoIIM required for sporulation
MSPGEFIRQHEHEWRALKGAMDALLLRRRRWLGSARPLPPGFAMADFPAHYRRLCQHLVLAHDRHYPPQLVERLNALAIAGHEVLYGNAAGLAGPRLSAFALHEFPGLVRRHAGLFQLSLALTVLPALGMALAVWLYPEWIYSLIDLRQVRNFENMYRDGSAHLGAARDADTNLMMFGYYISHNISVGFRCFAGGLLLGVGTAGALVFNGLLLGGLAAYLTRIGSGPMFFEFVIGHSAFELTAIILCGMAGLMLANALLRPGRQLRRVALALAARDAMRIVYGAAAMLVVAAFIEAFWSSNRWLPRELKFAAAAVWWSMVALYFLRMGRSRAL